MKFCWVTLPVGNMEKSLSFYEGVLGLSIYERYKGGGQEIVMLGEQGKPKIELLYNEEQQGKSFRSDMSLGIQVESLEATMAYLKSKQIDIVRGPIAPNPQIQFIFIHDPDGYEVQLVEMK